MWGSGKLQLLLVQCSNANWATSPPPPPERGLQPPVRPLGKGHKGSKRGLATIVALPENSDFDFNTASAVGAGADGKRDAEELEMVTGDSPTFLSNDA